jgi:hypothetical protein
VSIVTPFDRAWTLLKSRDFGYEPGDSLYRPPEGRGKLPRSVPYVQFDQQQTLSEFEPAFSPTFIRPRTRAELFRTHREGLLNAAEPGLYRIEEDDNVQQPDKPTHVKRIHDPERGVVHYVLMGERGPLSKLTAGDMYGQKGGLIDFTSATHPAHRRQGHYGTLINSLVQAGYPVHSINRNHRSHPFHTKFQRNLPADMEPNVRDNAMKVWGEEQDTSDILYDPTGHLFSYERKPMSELTPENWGALRPMTSDFVPLRGFETKRPDTSSPESRAHQAIGDDDQNTLFTWQMNPEGEFNLVPNDEYRYQN